MIDIQKTESNRSIRDTRDTWDTEEASALWAGGQRRLNRGVLWTSTSAGHPMAIRHRVNLGRMLSFFLPALTYCAADTYSSWVGWVR
jgi:hypothetical protein